MPRGNAMIQIDCFDITQMDRPGYERLYRQASPERRLRADKCLKAEDKLRCIAADALLRRSVARVLGRSEFTVEKGNYGKPSIQNAPDFHYNLSHSGPWAVIAYGGSPVGIDVEAIRPGAPVEKLVRRFFTQAEQEYVRGSTERFFEIWTRKESYLKYLGTGLRRSLDSFCVLPDGSHLGIRFHRETLEGCCVALCTTEEAYRLSRLTCADF